MSGIMAIDAYRPLIWDPSVAESRARDDVVVTDGGGNAEQGGAFSAAYREAVLAVVEAIPRGRVMAYSAIADYLADAWRIRAPRLIGRIMAGCDRPVPWHRVVQASGAPARGLEAEALRRLRRDATPLRGNRVEMRTAAWAPEAPPPRAPEAPPPRAPEAPPPNAPGMPPPSSPSPPSAPRDTA